MYRLEAKEREEATAARQSQPPAPQPQSSIPPISKAAPWSHSNLLAGASLEEIQKAERQKRAEQAALLQQQRALQQQQLQQQQLQQQQVFNGFAVYYVLIDFLRFISGATAECW